MANALWLQVVSMSEFRKRKWLLGAASQAPQKHSPSVPPTEPSKAGRKWVTTPLSTQIERRYQERWVEKALTRVQSQSGKPHWPPTISASGMIWPNDFYLIWLQSPLPSSIQLSPNHRMFCSLITNVWFINNLRVVKTGEVGAQSIGYATLCDFTVFTLCDFTDWATELNWTMFTPLAFM